MRRPALLAITIAITAATFALAGAAGAGSTTSKIDLSTDAAVIAYLESVGIDPATTVIQRGLNNYAGPNCPGAEWNCTTATSVVQIAEGGGSNLYEGNAEFFSDGEPPFPVPETFVPLSPPTAADCMVMQETESGHNHARCFQRSTTNPAALKIAVLQQNVDGDNFFQGHQQIRQREDAIQEAHEDVEITQDNVEGNNHLHVVSQISQFTSETTEEANPLPPMQEQDGTFSFQQFPGEFAVQDTETGNNFGRMFQQLHQDGRASGPETTVQHQTADQFGEVDQFAEEPVDLLSNGDGQGFSQFFAHQSKSQNLVGPGIQKQDDPGACCGAGTQTGDPQQTFMKILEESDQRASQGTAEQSLTLLGSCNSTGQCEITHHARNDEDSTTAMNDGTGPTFLTTHCESSEVEENEGTGMCESTEVPPFDDD